jgi:hypothetical protein
MPNLAFRTSGASVLKWAVSPSLALRVEVSNQPADEAVYGLLLHCQVRIDAPARPYSTAEEGRLTEIFGDPSRWGQTLQTLLWANVGLSVGAFTGQTEIELPLPCTFDVSSAAAKYLLALEGGEVPLSLLFSGTVFFARSDGALQASQIPWSSEASFVLPARVWRETVDHYFPNCASVRLRRDVFERLHLFRITKGLMSFDHAIEALLREQAP